MTPDEVQLLNDEQLRDLLRLLLEAEARQQGIPLSSIFVGSDQNAADGGVDGRIEWIGDPEPAGWIPRRKIFFNPRPKKCPRLN